MRQREQELFGTTAPAKNDPSLGPAILSEDEKSYRIRDIYGQEAVIPKDNPSLMPTVDAIRRLDAAKARKAERDAAAAPAPIIPKAGDVASDINATPVSPLAPAPIAPMIPPTITTMDSQSKTASQSTIMRPQDQKRLENATLKIGEAEAKVADAKIAKADAETQVYDTIANDLKLRNEEQMARETERQAAVTARIEGVDSAIKDLAQTKINPNSFADASTGNKILTSIGLLLGGLGAGMAGSDKNLALEAFNKAMDRDIEAQKANLQVKRDTVEAQRGSLKDFIAQTGDMRAAELAEKQRIMEVYKVQLDALASKNLPAQVLAGVQKTQAELEQQMANTIAERNKIIESKETQKQIQSVPNPAATKAGKPMELVDQPIQQEYRQTQNVLQGIDEIEKLAGYDAEGKLGPIDAAVNKLSRRFGIDNKDTTLLRTRVIQMLADKIKAISGAAAAQQEFERLEATLPNLSDNPETFFAVLRQERKALEQKLLGIEESYKGVRALPNRFVGTLDEEIARKKEKYRSPSK